MVYAWQYFTEFRITPHGVPIHPSCANSSLPVVNFIFFNKTKTEVPELKQICYNLLAVCMTSLEAITIKKGCQFAPVSPTFLERTNFTRNLFKWCHPRVL